jgi:hypothetical protein
MSVDRVVDGTAEVVLDNRLGSILIATWFGSPTPPVIEGFHAWVDEQIAEALARDRKLVLINDSTDSERTGPDARRQFTDHQFDMSVLVGVQIVITNPLIRGAITAVGWMLGDRMKGVTIWKTLPEAFAHARTVLREVGAKPPSPSRINGYARPHRYAGDSHPVERR